MIILQCLLEGFVIPNGVFLSQLPSSSTWGQQSNSGGCQSQNTLSLAEIQKIEEERERQLREEVNTNAKGT